MIRIVPLVMDTGERKSRMVIGGGGSSPSSTTGIMTVMVGDACEER